MADNKNKKSNNFSELKIDIEKDDYGNFLCAFCDGATTTQIVALTIKRKRRKFTFQNVKAEVCQKCGESYYDGKSLLQTDDRKSKEFDKKILSIQQEIRELRKQKKQEKLLEAKKKKQPGRSGRPRVKPEFLKEARELAKTKTLSFVAFKLDISLATLRRYGITRNALNKEKAEADLRLICEARSKK